MKDQIVLEARSIGKFFHEPKKFRVLDDISFQVKNGEFVSMVGKSGSGKSTLLYVLSTMDSDYDGELFINNQLLAGKPSDVLSQIRNEYIGFVFQFHYLLPEFTALKNVMIPAMKLGKWDLQEIENKAYEKLDSLGIADQALKSANKLSGGQQQRVAIARALINEPAILLCDEPTGNLDSKNTNIVLDIFKQVTSELGQTVLAVTHDNDFANTSDRIIEMKDGNIISEN